MKSFLPKELKNIKSNTSGFTLIELLVVISIIAVLAVVGITIFSGVQARARDARRQADINAIAKALESNKVSGTTTYPALAATWFSGATVPTEPAGYVPQYSVSYVTAAGTVVNKPTAWAATGANPTSPTTTPTGGTVTTGTVGPATSPTVPPTGVYSYQVCALLESGTAPNIFCVANAQ